MAVFQKGALVATAWMDNKMVTVMSTNCEAGKVSSTTRKLKNGQRQEFPCPEAIVSYSTHMHGVDHNDQIRQYYSVRTKSRKCYRYIFWFLFELTVANAFIIYRQNYKPDECVRTFQLTLAEELIGTYCSRKRAGRPPRDHQSLSIREQHFPKKIKTEKKKNIKRCYYCSVKGKRKETTWHCQECNLPFCHTGEDDGTDCFEQYHKKH